MGPSSEVSGGGNLLEREGLQPAEAVADGAVAQRVAHVPPQDHVAGLREGPRPVLDGLEPLGRVVKLEERHQKLHRRLAAAILLTSPAPFA